MTKRILIRGFVKFFEMGNNIVPITSNIIALNRYKYDKINPLQVLLIMFSLMLISNDYHQIIGFGPKLFSLSSLFLQRKIIKIITKGVTHVKHNQPLLFISCSLLDITAKEGRRVKGLYIKVNSPTSP